MSGRAEEATSDQVRVRRWQMYKCLLRCRDQAYIESIVDEVVAGVQGKRVYVEGEDDSSAKTGKNLE